LNTKSSYSRRYFLAGVVGTAAVALLAACGGSAPPTAAPTAAPAKPAEPAKAAEPTKPAAAPAAAGSTPAAGAAATTAPAGGTAAPAQGAQATAGTNVQAGVSGGTPTAPTPTLPAGAKAVVFWIPWGQPERQKWVLETGNSFRQKFGDQALQMEFVGFGNMRQRWIAAQQAGQMPELFNVGFQEVGAAFVAGAVEPADTLFQDMKGKETFFDGPMQVWSYQGKTFGLPWYVFPRLFYYRKDLYEAKGVKLPTDANSWYEGAKALTQAPDRWGSALAMDHAPEPIDYYMRGAGSAMFDKDGKVLLDSPEGVEAVDFFAKLIKDTAPQGTANYVEDDQVKLFISKDVGYILTWPAILQWMAQQAPAHVKDLGALVPPGKSTKPKAITSNIGFGMGKTAKNLDGARKYLQHIYSDDVYIGFLHSIAGVYPVTKSMAASPKFPDHPILKQFPDVVKVGQEASNDGVEAGYLYGWNPGNTLALATNPGLQQMMQAIVLQNMPVKQAVDEQVKRMNAAIAQMRR
jgi:ABC-type glycerol-3-phosphate transport system substrate-binding protein